LERLRALLALEHPAAADLEEALRRAHNLKGAARAVDLLALEALAHRLESLFSRVSQGSLELDEPARRLVHQGLDALEDYLAALARGQTPADPAPAREALERFLGEPEASPPPSLPEEAPRLPADTVRVRPEALEGLLASAGQLAGESLRQAGLAREVRELEEEFDRLARQFSRQEGQALRLLGRRVRRLTRGHQESAGCLQVLARRLNQQVAEILMVPARSVLEGFPHMVRELARNLGREVDFQMQGADILADRRVLQALKDPLMHLLRNALVHGLESPQERRRAGKSPRGRLVLALEARGGRLEVRVEDDGRGVDLEAVRQRARAQGLLARGQEPGLQELLGLLFRPGFSTSEALSEVAGRGIGLSVVQECLARLQGEVEVRPGRQGGTCFRLSLPLTVAAQPLLLIGCQGRTYALPARAVERLYRVQTEALPSLEGRPALLHQDELLPLWSLAFLLGLEEEPALTPLEGRLAALVLRGGGRRLALAVDGFLEALEGVVRDLGAARSALAAGGLLLGDGSVCLVLSPAALVEACRGLRQAPVLRPPKPSPAAPRTPTILVVDDSLTTRTLERTILEAQGYQVLLAVDGVEALHLLRTEQVDLAVVDIQMPRMDGFELLAAMKADPRLSSVPVILLTSLDSPQDQERGLNLGAEAYLVKRKFDQRELLDTVRQIL
jgi:two-component system chemotaxis sensor kinase CheA